MKFGSQETRRIALSYGVDILTDDYSVLSQSTCLTNRQTDKYRQQKLASKTVRCALKTKLTYQSVYHMAGNQANHNIAVGSHDQLLTSKQFHLCRANKTKLVLRHCFMTRHNNR